MNDHGIPVGDVDDHIVVIDIVGIVDQIFYKCLYRVQVGSGMSIYIGRPSTSD